MTRMNSSFDQAVRNLDEVVRVADSLYDYSLYAFNPNIIPDMGKSMRMDCEWCHNDEGDSLIDIIKQKIGSHVDEMKQQLVEMREEVDDIYGNFLVALADDDDKNIEAILQKRLPEVMERSTKMASGIYHGMIQPLSHASAYIEEFERIFQPKCQYILDTYIEEHADMQDNMNHLLEPLTDLIAGQFWKYADGWQAYMDANITLEALTGSLNVQDFNSRIEYYSNEFSSFLIGRMQLTDRVENHVNNLYMYLAAQMKADHFFEKSGYMKKFNFTSMQVVEDETVTLGDSDFFMEHKLSLQGSTNADVSYYHKSRDHNMPFRNSALRILAMHETRNRPLWYILINNSVNTPSFKVVPYSVWRSNFVLTILAVCQIGGHSFSAVWKDSPCRFSCQ